MKYLIVFEKSSNGYGAYAPDLPGLGVVGRTLAETRKLMQRGIEVYLEELQVSAGAVSKPSASSPIRSTPAKRIHTKPTPERAAAHG